MVLTAGSGQEVSPSFFPLLGASAAVGRTFTEDEGEIGNNKVVVLSHGLWRELYGGDPSVVGNTMRIDAEPFVIVGVMPQDFVFINPDVRLWAAAAFTPQQRQQYHSNSWQMIARLQPDATIERAQEQIDALNAANMDKMPSLKPLLIDAGFHTPLYFLQEDLTFDISGTLYLLWGDVGFVLLIGAVNVANLVLVRSTARTRELATRFALGARRGRVARQLLTEIIVLTLVGGAAGLGVGWLGLQALTSLGIDQLPRSGEIGLDMTAVAFTMGLALLIGCVVALIPAATLLRLDLSSVFREEGRSGTAGRGVRTLRKGMVVAQVAFALMLLVGAGLLMASFREVLNVDPGFEPRGVLTGSLTLTAATYPEDGDLVTFTRTLIERVSALPGVDAVAATTQIPFGNSSNDSVIFAEGYVPEPGEAVVSPLQNVVTPGYFEAMGIEVLRGRSFDSRDTADGQPVIVVDEQLADRFWPDGSALGSRMWMPTSVEDVTNSDNATFLEVVGVVARIRTRGLDAGPSNTGAYYFAYEQSARRSLDVVFTTSGEPRALIASVRQAIAEIDRDLPLFDVRTMQERIDASLVNRRTPMLLTAGFSVVALLLAAVGIYGVLAYLVQLRTREIGIRVALGSAAPAIFKTVLGEGALIVAAGLLLGAGGIVLLGRFIETQLYGVSTMDPAVLGLVATLLAVVAMVACLVPARRATRIDPVAALAQD